MIPNKFFSYLPIVIATALITTFASCDDKTQGCTDPEAENYNSEATSNDGTCIYARDKFVGEYSGNLNCLGVLSVSLNGETTFNIDESSSGVDKVDITIMTEPILRLEGTINGDVMTIRDTIPDITADPFGTFNLIASGDLTITNQEMNIAGTLNVVIQSGLTISDNCEIEGMKK